MRKEYPKEFQIQQGEGAQSPADGVYQILHPRIKDYFYYIIFSTGEGWEHLSVTLRAIVSKTKRLSRTVERTPTWQEMCFLKDLFWDETECVVQYHPPTLENISNHNYCLHLWKQVGSVFPMPPSILVGVVNMDKVVNALMSHIEGLTKEEACEALFNYANSANVKSFPSTDDDIELFVKAILTHAPTESL